MEDTFRLALPMLPTVTVFAADVVLVFTLPNARVVGVKVACGAGAARPITARVVLSGLDAASVMKWALAERAPAAAGTIRTFTVHKPPMTTAAPVQLSLLNNTSPEFVPVAVTLVTFRVAVPELVSVMVWVGVEVPTVVLPKSIAVGVSVTAGAAA